MRRATGRRIKAKALNLKIYKNKAGTDLAAHSTIQYNTGKGA